MTLLREKVTVNGAVIVLSPKEYDLLSYRNIALTRGKLISEVWGYDYYGDDRMLDTHVKLLRKTLANTKS